MIFGQAFAQDKTALDTIYVDACSRHEVLIAEMTRGRGVNSNEIDEFVSGLEIVAYVQAYSDWAGGFADRNEALRYILAECMKRPTATINEILFLHYVDQQVGAEER
jgi:hypothetical protein